MARERTGSVVFHRGRYFAVLTLDVEGTSDTRREWIDLDTRDPAKAKRLRDKLVAEANAGRLLAKAKGEIIKHGETNAALLPAYIESRRGSVTNAQLANWTHDYEARIKVAIGDVLPGDTTKAMLRNVLERAKADLARDAMAHLRQLLVAYFGDLEERELIAASPARKLKLPDGVRDRDPRPRTLVTDAEFRKCSRATRWTSRRRSWRWSAAPSAGSAARRRTGSIGAA